MLEREDGYIYGTQPCNYYSEQQLPSWNGTDYVRSAMSAQSVDPPLHRLDTRRKFHDEFNSSDVSPSKRRCQPVYETSTLAETSVDDSSAPSTILQSEELSEVDYHQQVYHARMMALETESDDGVEQPSDVGSESGRSLAAEEERRTRTRLAAYRNTNADEEGQKVDSTRFWSRMLEQDMERLHRLRALSRSISPAGAASNRQAKDGKSVKTPALVSQESRWESPRDITIQK